jgi:MFS transporter, UMF1 family
MEAGYDKRKVFAWAFYDWANSAYATTIMAGFFPIFFKQFWSAGVDVRESTLHLGTANSIASIIVAVLAPTLGSIADRGSTRKLFLSFFAALGICMTSALAFVGQGLWVTAMALYIVANIGFAGGNIFYDSLLVSVANKKRMDFVSALGYSLGYLGGGVLFALTVTMTLYPHSFGLESATEAVRISFLFVAVWWAIFSVPLFVFVKETGVGGSAAGWSAAIQGGFRQLRSTFREIRKHRVIFLFLIGYWFYIDGVDTVILMAVDYGITLGFDTSVLIKALLITQFVGFPAALAFGKMGERIGTKRSIYIGISVYVGVAIWGFFMREASAFYALAISVGLVQGGVQSLSRSFYAKLIPKESAAEFFGFYNMLGKFAAVIGPLLMGWISVTTGNPRLSILAIIALFLVGGACLYFVKEPDDRDLDSHGQARGTNAIHA